MDFREEILLWSPSRYEGIEKALNSPALFPKGFVGSAVIRSNLATVIPCKALGHVATDCSAVFNLPCTLAFSDAASRSVEPVRSILTGGSKGTVKGTFKGIVKRDSQGESSASALTNSQKEHLTQSGQEARQGKGLPVPAQVRQLNTKAASVKSGSNIRSSLVKLGLELGIYYLGYLYLTRCRREGKSMWGKWRKQSWLERRWAIWEVAYRRSLVKAKIGRFQEQLAIEANAPEPTFGGLVKLVRDAVDIGFDRLSLAHFRILHVYLN
jgi:hypothetical protein